MKKLLKLPGACAVLVLAYLAQVPEDTVIRIAKLHSFEPGEGMADEDWIAAAKTLKIDFETVHLGVPYIELRKAVKRFSDGTYIVSTFDHLFVIDNGVVVDPRTPEPGLRRRIKQAWRVIK